MLLIQDSPSSLLAAPNIDAYGFNRDARKCRGTSSSSSTGLTMVTYMTVSLLAGLPCLVLQVIGRDTTLSASQLTVRNSTLGQRLNIITQVLRSIILSIEQLRSNIETEICHISFF